MVIFHGYVSLPEGNPTTIEHSHRMLWYGPNLLRWLTHWNIRGFSFSLRGWLCYRLIQFGLISGSRLSDANGRILWALVCWFFKMPHVLHIRIYVFKYMFKWCLCICNSHCANNCYVYTTLYNSIYLESRYTDWNYLHGNKNRFRTMSGVCSGSSVMLELTLHLKIYL